MHDALVIRFKNMRKRFETGLPLLECCTRKHRRIYDENDHAGLRYLLPEATTVTQRSANRRSSCIRLNRLVVLAVSSVLQ